MSTRIPVTTKLDLRAAIDLNRALLSAPPDTEYLFDFVGLFWAEPLGALYAANAIRCFVAARSGSRFLVDNFKSTNCHSYLGHIGFFKAFGLDHGNEPGEARGSSSYLPITEVEIAGLKAQAFDTGRSLAEMIQAKADDLVNVLTQRRGGEGREALVFAFREVMRNAAEHSESATLWYSAQYWPANGAATIALLDTGVGLRQSLTQNPYLRVKDDKDAIRFALLPGISGKCYPGARGNRFSNAGFGLFMTSALSRACGRFVIASGGHGLSWTAVSKTYFEANMDGTALDITINTGAVAGLDGRIDDLRKRGERIEITCRRVFEAGGSLSGESASKILMH